MKYLKENTLSFLMDYQNENCYSIGKNNKQLNIFIKLIKMRNSFSDRSSDSYRFMLKQTFVDYEIAYDGIVTLLAYDLYELNGAYYMGPSNLCALAKYVLDIPVYGLRNDDMSKCLLHKRHPDSVFHQFMSALSRIPTFHDRSIHIPKSFGLYQFEAFYKYQEHVQKLNSFIDSYFNGNKRKNPLSL